MVTTIFPAKKRRAPEKRGADSFKAKTRAKDLHALIDREQRWCLGKPKSSVDDQMLEFSKLSRWFLGKPKSSVDDQMLKFSKLSSYYIAIDSCNYRT